MLLPLSLQWASLLSLWLSMMSWVVIADLPVGSSVSFRATTSCCTTRYIAHTGSTVNTQVVSSSSDPALKRQASWTVRAGLGDSTCYSFESVDTPGSYIRHFNYQLMLNTNDGTSTFTQDATFCPENGLSGQGTSLRSLNYSDRYWRHFNAVCYIASNGGPHDFDSSVSYKDDVSFVVSPGFSRSGEGCWRDSPCSGPASASFSGPWEADNLSPKSRQFAPVRVLDGQLNVVSDWKGQTNLAGNGALRIFDFGKEVGGVLNLQYSACGKGSLGIAFSESSNFTGVNSDESNGSSGSDGAITVPIDASQCNTRLGYTLPDAKQRGGFRYLSLYSTAASNSNINVTITDINLEISFQPTWPDLRAYQGYFHSSDQLLNRIWYAGAYTIQTTAVSPNSGREYPLVNQGWMNDANLGTTAPTVLVDGAKRDRAIWAGDLGVATRSALVSTGDMDSVKNALDVQYTHQVRKMMCKIFLVCRNY